MTLTSFLILIIIIAIAMVLARAIGWIVYIFLMIGIIMWAAGMLTGAG